MALWKRDEKEELKKAMVSIAEISRASEIANAQTAYSQAADYRRPLNYPVPTYPSHAHMGGAQTHQIPYPQPIQSWNDTKRTLLYMRLELLEGGRIPFEFLEFMRGEDCVYVTVAKTRGDKPVVIEDDLGLFPSDTLVTQLRLMMG